MLTHGDYKAQIDKMMGISSASNKRDNTESEELQKLKKQLKREKQSHSKYKNMYAETLVKEEQ